MTGPCVTARRRYTLTAWRRERLAAVPDGVGIELAPDWVCEVISPSTGQVDREIKLPRYALAGVDSLWRLDPLARRLEVLTRSGDGWRFLEASGRGDRERAAVRRDHDRARAALGVIPLPAGSYSTLFLTSWK